MLQHDKQELETWVKQHPIQANVYGIAVLVLAFEIGAILVELVKYAARN